MDKIFVDASKATKSTKSLGYTVYQQNDTVVNLANRIT